jgi:uncharacterized RmlC-like cupin family protein
MNRFRRLDNRFLMRRWWQSLVAACVAGAMLAGAAQAQAPQQLAPSGQQVSREQADTIMQPTNAVRAPLMCRVVRSDETYVGQQGLTYFAGIAAETVGSCGICMHLVRLPPGVRAHAHLHEQHETAIYVLSGEVEMWYGERLEQHLVVRAGEFLYIPANMPHQPFNATQLEAVAVLARTDPNEQESVTLLPALDAIHRSMMQHRSTSA